MSWRFLTNHGRALMCVAHDPHMRLRDIAAALNITERAAQKLMSDLVAGGYVTRTRVGRRNVYDVHADAPLPLGRELRVRDMFSTFEGDPAGRQTA
jgi:predicted MarR family transcription regulator